MERLRGRIAVVTGGGTGMGRELVRQLAEAGCDVATCDVSGETLVETERLALAEATDGARVMTFVADVADEAALTGFRDAVVASFATDHIHLLFNNAGIGGGGSLVNDDRVEWERTFGVDWGGVYLSTRCFLPLLLAADEGHVINTSSVNGFWGSLGPTIPHTAYSAAKFAVKGFTEALITDFRMNAPHLRASVVMPGHIGTSIVINSAKAHGTDPETMDDARLAQFRGRLIARGLPLEGVSDDDLRQGLRVMGESFRDAAPMTAAEAATVILAGVKANAWRILVGADAEELDRAVRAAPEDAYETGFFEALQKQGHLGGV
ncbi:MAG TPA: SDR family oxidoreductase, partial [Acidimicrobiales bacterium]|nr:SDR family oxidoreductase [Acidimicrobiales bacterium]